MKASKPVKAKKKIKLGKYIVIVVIVLQVTAGYFLYNWAFKSGYAAGTKNQIICQASEVQDSLKSVCVK